MIRDVVVGIVLACFVLGMVPISVATFDSSIPKYVSGVFKSEGFEPSNHLTVPVGSSVDTIITLQGDNNMVGTLKVEIRKDLPGSPDLLHKSLIKQISGINNIEEFNVGSFVASVKTTEYFREYFYRVYWNDKLIYDPTDPAKREWVKTTIPKYMSGVFKSENFEPSNHLTVPVGSTIETIITLQGNNYMIGTLKVEIRKDFSKHYDPTHKTLIKQITGINNIEEFNVGSFVASRLTTGNFREYFYRVYWNDELIYDPEDHDEREWVKTTPIAPFIRILKDEIKDKNPDLAEIQGIVEIPFEYYLPHHVQGHWCCFVKINDDFYTAISRRYAKVNKPSDFGSGGEKDRESIWVTSHLFENGNSKIVIEAAGGNSPPRFSDEVNLTFQNKAVVNKEEFESNYSEGIFDFHPEVNRDELQDDFGQIYQKLLNFGYTEDEIKGAELEFKGDIEKHKDEIIAIARAAKKIKWGKHYITAGASGPLGIAACIKSYAVSEVVFFVAMKASEATEPSMHVKYSQAPVGDLEGNVYAVHAVTESLIKDYVNAQYKVKAIHPFFLNTEGEWVSAFGFGAENIYVWKGPDADCIEWLKPTTIKEGKPTTIKEGETETFKLKIKENVIPNLYTEEMHLDLEIPRGVKISNAKVNGEKTEILQLVLSSGRYSIMSPNWVETKGRVIINIPKVGYLKGGEEVSFDITIKEKKQESVEILYGLIPGKVYRGGTSLGSTAVNPITLPETGRGHGQRWHYYPFELKHSFEITPSIPPEIDFNVLLKPDKTTYRRGETAQVTIDVTNNRDQDTEIWLGTTFKYPTLKEPKDIPLKRAVIPKGETESFDDIEWTIPADAPLGQYEIAVNCWKDAGQNEYYTDNIVWAPIFNVDMITPVKARENVEDALGALASMAEAYYGFMELIYELSEVEPPEGSEVEFNYHVLSSRFCNNIAEAQTYMSSSGIESADMNDALELVRELELAKTGFCIVIVDYSFMGFGEYESGTYPIVCNEKGDPFWESWQFYEMIKEEIEVGYKEYEG